MKTERAVLVVALLFSLLAAGLARAAPAAEGAAGLWSGEIHHNKQTSEFALHLVDEEGGGFAASISIPAIDVWELPIGVASLNADTLHIGGWTLHFDSERRRLTGVLPASLVPVHRIPLTLVPADTLPGAPSASVLPAAPSIEPLWTRGTGGAIWAGVACAEGRVFAGSDDGAVYAVDGRGGEIVWRFETAGAIRARPSVDGAYLLVHSDDGYLYRLRIENGEEVWRVRLLDSPTERIPPGKSDSRYDHYASSATVDQGRIYVGEADGSLYCLSAETGAQIWRAETGDAVRSTPALYQGTVVVGSFDGVVYAFDANTGASVWKRDTHAPVVSSPAVGGNLVLIGSRSYDFFALNATGEPVWTYYCWFSWIESSAVVRDSTAYVGSSDAQALMAFHCADGRMLWRVDTGGSAWAEPAVGESSVFIGTVGVAGYIVDHQGGFVAVDRHTGTVLGYYASPRPKDQGLWGFASSPALHGGRVYVGGLDGTIYAFEAVSPASAFGR